jgi:hypothetical protein
MSSTARLVVIECPTALLASMAQTAINLGRLRVNSHVCHDVRFFLNYRSTDLPSSTSTSDGFR